MITFLFFLGLILGIVLVTLSYKKIEPVKCISLGLAGYFALYILSSGLFVWVDFFSIKKAAALTVLVELIIILWMIVVKKKRFGKITFPLIKYLYILPVFVASFFLAQNKSGMYSTSQDEGIYQAKALAYIGYNNDNIWKFDEYYNVINSYEQQMYRDALGDMDGYYLLEDNEDSVTWGVLHGVNTFPAVLALWGWCFGISSIPYVLTLFYILSAMLVFYVCDNLKFKHYLSMLLSALFAICPIVIWCAQNTITEMLFTMLMVAFFTYITEDDKEHMIVWSVLPLVGACYYHVLMTVLIPMFLIAYLISYVCGKDKGAVKAVVILLLSYASGLNMMFVTARRYTVKNFEQLFQKTGNLLNEKNLVPFVWVVSVLLIIMSLVLDYFGIFSKVRAFIKGKRDNKKAVKIFSIAVWIVIALIVIFFGYKTLKVRYQDMMIGKMSIMGYVIMSGYIMVPMAFAAIVLGAKKLLGDRRRLIIYFSLIYVLLMYGGVLMVLIYYYYYYARYLAPFMLLVLVAAGYLFNRFKPYVTVPLVIFAGAIVISQSAFIYSNRDVTYINYEEMEKVASYIGEGDAVLIREEGFHLHRIFMLPLKGLTRCDIYFVNPDAFAAQLFEISGLYENIYVLTYAGSFGNGISILEEEYEATLNISIYDSFIEKGTFLPYANELMDDYTQSVILYRVNL